MDCIVAKPCRCGRYQLGKLSLLYGRRAARVQHAGRYGLHSKTLDTIGKTEGVDRFRHVRLGRADASNKGNIPGPFKGLLQCLREDRVPVRDVRLLAG